MLLLNIWYVVAFLGAVSCEAIFVIFYFVYFLWHGQDWFYTCIPPDKLGCFGTPIDFDSGHNR
jgi:hypothetical protein